MLRQIRLCKNCKKVEDEVHFFLECDINSKYRLSLFNNVKKEFSDFDAFSTIQKLECILNPKIELLKNVCDFIKQSLELRK